MKALKVLLEKHLASAAESYQNNQLPEDGWLENQAEQLIKEIYLLKLEGSPSFAEKLLEVYGYAPEDLNCANAETAISELLDSLHDSNLVSLLDSFVVRCTVEDLIKLKKLTNK